MIPEALGYYAFCPTCWNVNKTCLDEAAGSLAELAARWRSREQLVSRVSDLLRRTGVDDAEILIREIERRIP